MTSTSFIFTELANTMKYGGGFSYNVVFTEWRHCVSQNKYQSKLSLSYTELDLVARDGVYRKTINIEMV